jgi:succinylarginine dihydrolase
LIAYEVNFDGIVGPTHNYGGLARGNVASQQNVHAISNPRAAAKQGLRKMKMLFDLGVPQAVLPPQDRPAVEMLRALGFEGSDHEVIRKAGQQAPRLLAACASASSMWAANAATVCPSVDSEDGKVHFTPANLRSHFHRQIEVPTTARVLRRIFADAARFVHHAPLPPAELFGDEGAANHSRLCKQHGEPGTQLFVYGRRALSADAPSPSRHPARQTLEASEAVSRLHGTPRARTVFAQQQLEAIDAGAFHNDVIAVANQNVFFFHRNAFVNAESVMQELRDKGGLDLHLIEVGPEEVPIDEAVSTYLFNSQLVTLPSGQMALVVPAECRASARVWGYLRELVQRHSVIRRVEVSDVRQSMQNGGGPACLRLRVVLTAEEMHCVHRSVLFDEELFERLDAWVEGHYRDRLGEPDLRDPQLLDESRTALDELTRILDLEGLYDFQQ